VAEAACVHIRAVTSVKVAKRRGCEDCVKIGADWVHRRTCQACGSTRCCDDSPNRHATKHARASHHPVIASAEPGETGVTAWNVLNAVARRSGPPWGEASRILGLLADPTAPLDDDELAAHIGVARQQVNQRCRHLALAGPSYRAARRPGAPAQS